MALNGPVWSLWSHMVQFGPVGSHFVFYGPLWSLMVLSGPLWSRVASFDPVGPYLFPYICLPLFNSHNFCTNFVLVTINFDECLENICLYQNTAKDYGDPNLCLLEGWYSVYQCSPH